MRRVGTFALAALLAAGSAQASYGDDNPKDGRFFDVDVAAGVPNLLAAELRIVAVSHLEFGFGGGAFPINSIAQGLYSFSPVVLNSTYSLTPTGTYSLSGIYAFVRWFPWGRGLFLNLGAHFIQLGASISAPLVNTSTNASVSGAVSSSVTVNQVMLELGPGYQFFIGDHFHVDLGLGVVALLTPSASTNVGGSIADLAVLDPTAQANYTAAKSSLANAVSQAMTTYENSLRFLPAATLSLGYVF